MNTRTNSRKNLISTFAFGQLNFTVGDFDGNVAKIKKVYNKHANDAGWVVFSELSLCGYYPDDLIERRHFFAEQDRVLRELQTMTVGKSAWLVVGGVQKNTTGIGKAYHNGVWVVGDGLIQGTYQKRLLPTYNIFDERRHFEPGASNLVVEREGLRVGFLICEDVWNIHGHDYKVDPVKEIVSQNIQMLVAINASPSNEGKAKQRFALMRELCKTHQVPMLYVNQVGANDQLVFDGGSFFLDKGGSVPMRASMFEEADGRVWHDACRGWQSNITRLGEFVDGVALFEAHALLGLKDYMCKQGMKSVVVGCSGGIDSGLTIALAAKALGAENVIAITMPSQYSSDGSVSDSVVLCANLGVKLLTRPIESEVQEAIKNFESAFGKVPSTLTVENIQARIRGRILMEYSNEFGNLVLSTGNKSEMSVGYATLYGDMNGGLNLIGDLYKMEVYALSKHMNATSGGPCIPQAIIDKEPSAELRPGQRDQDSLPPYPVLDAILREYVELEYVSHEQKLIDIKHISEVSDETVREVLAKVDKAEFKRRQAPPIIRMHGKAFGQGRKIPIVQKLPPMPVDALT